MSLPQDDQDFIVQQLSQGFTPKEIHYKLKKDHDSYVRLEIVEQFCEQDSVEERVDLARQVREKEAANVDKQELLSDLKEIKGELKDQISKLRRQDNNDISNDTMSNLISNIKLMGEFIGELKQQESDTETGTINVNKLEQNFKITSVVQHLPEEDKKDVAEQLAEDPDVEDFMVVRSGE